MAEIQDFLSPKALEQIDGYLKSLVAINDKYVQLAKTYDTIASKTSETIKNEQELEKLNQQRAKTDRELIKNEQLLTKESERLAQQQQKAIIQAEKEASAYEQLKKQYNDAAKKAQDYGATLGTLSSEYITAAKEAKSLNDKLYEIEIGVGKGQRKVGQYSQAIEGASLSLGEMKKALKELKNTSFEGKTAEEIADLKKRIGELTDEMGDMQTEMKMMGTENAAVLVGGLKFIAAGVEGVVGSLSLFGVESDVIKNLETKMTSLIAVTQALAEIEDTVSSGKLKAIALRVQDMALTIKDNIVKWANTTATIAQTKAEEAKAVITGKASIITKAAAAIQWLWNAALAANPIGLVIAGVAALAGGITLLIVAMKNNNDEIERQTKAYEALAQKNKEYLDMQNLLFEAHKAAGLQGSELTKQELKLAQDRKKQINEELDALEAISEKNEDQKKQWSDLLDEYTKTGDNIIILKAKLTKELADENKKQKEDEQKKLDDQKKANEKANEEQQSLDEETLAAWEKIKQEEADLAQKQRDDKLAGFLAEKAAFDKNQEEIAASLEKNEMRQINIENENRKKRLAAEKEFADKKKELNQAIYSEAVNLMDGLFSLQQARYSKELSDLDDYYSSRIDAAEANGQDTTALEKEYARKKEEIQEKANQSEKRAKIANILATTAEKALEIQATAATYSSNVITAPLAVLAYAQLGLLLANSAIQIAAVKAAYAKGTKDSASEFIAGEEGSELMILQDGSMEITPDQATYYKGSKYQHAEIFPHAETQRILAEGQINGLSLKNVEAKLDKLINKDTTPNINIINRYNQRFEKRYEKMRR